jgi:hypothetical protein
VNQFHDEDVVIQVPAAPRLGQGTKGTGTFSFEALETVGSLVRLVVKDEFAERDRFMRANLDAMARRVGLSSGLLWSACCS